MTCEDWADIRLPFDMIASFRILILTLICLRSLLLRGEYSLRPRIRQLTLQSDHEYQNCPLHFDDKIRFAKFLSLEMSDFDISIGMNWLTVHRAPIVSHTKSCHLFSEEIVIFCLRVRSLLYLFVKRAYGCILGCYNYGIKARLRPVEPRKLQEEEVYGGSGWLIQVFGACGVILWCSWDNLVKRFGEEVLIFCLRVRSLRCLFVKGAYGCILSTLFRLVQDQAANSLGTISGTLFLNGRTIFVLFDTGATHSVVSVSFAKHLSIFPTQLNYTLSIYTPIKSLVIIDHKYQSCPLHFDDKIRFANLLPLEMSDFDISLGLNLVKKGFGEDVLIFCLRVRYLRCLFAKIRYLDRIFGNLFSLLKSLPELFELVMEGAYGCIIDSLFCSVQDQAANSSGTVSGSLFLNGRTIFVLFDTGATHSVVSVSFAKHLSISPTLLNDALSIFMPMKRLTTNIRTVRFANLLPLEMSDFDIILGMDFGEEVLIFCLRVRSLRCMFSKEAYGCILGNKREAGI
ncbi:reverse transcriptase domain-containing protein [Tanacetum coccineum]